MRHGGSISGLPPSDFASTSQTPDIFSDPACFLYPHNLPYRDANQHDDRHNSDLDSRPHIKTSPPRSRSPRDEPWGVARKRPRRSSDPSKSDSSSESATFNDGDFDRVGGRERERLANTMMSPSRFASGSSLSVPKRKHFFCLFDLVHVAFQSPFGCFFPSAGCFVILLENSTGAPEPLRSMPQSLCYIIPREPWERQCLPCSSISA
jgi:hypothetical protein